MPLLSRHLVAPLVIALAWLLLGTGLPARAQTMPGTGLPLPPTQATESDVGGPVRLREPAAAVTPRRGATQAEPGARQSEREATVPEPLPYIPGEFERFVQSQVDTRDQAQSRGDQPLRAGEAGRTARPGPIRRFGAELVTDPGDGRAAELSPLVPDDYVIGPGDEVLVTLWGSVDAELRLLVDRGGRITIPRVGPVQVGGLRYADLGEVVNRRVAQVFRNFQSSVALGQLRGIRVFVTGFVARPGTYTVSSLSSVVSVLMRAGGPSAAGSFRDIALRRGSQLVGRFDLYDLLLKGDRSADRIVQGGDVIHVGAVGTQIGFIGSVNRPAVLELKPGETVSDALRMVGGFTAVADRTRLAIERLQERNAGRVAELELPRDERAALADGDVLRAFSAVAAVLPSQRQSKRVKVEGEVARPAEYVLPEGSSVRDAVRAAGGYTSAAYVFAAELTRDSVQRTQQEGYDRALRDLETDMARTAGSQRVSTAEDAGTQAARASATSRLIERLRALRPTGRIVLQLPPQATDLPDLALEDGDRIYIPPRPTTVGIFGSVFNAATYLYSPERTIGDYLRLAGGPTKGADEDSIFVVRANGNVVSERQAAGLFRSSEIAQLPSEPGDTVFVPEQMDKTTFLQAAKDWTQVLFQFGLGVAGIKSAVK